MPIQNNCFGAPPLSHYYNVPMCAGPSVTSGMMPSPLTYNWPIIPQCHYLTVSIHIEGVVCWNANNYVSPVTYCFTLPALRHHLI